MDPPSGNGTRSRKRTRKGDALGYRDAGAVPPRSWRSSGADGRSRAASGRPGLRLVFLTPSPVCWSASSGCAPRGSRPRGTPRPWRAGPGSGAASSPGRRRRCRRTGPSRRARRSGRRAGSARGCRRGWPSQRHRPRLVEAGRLGEGIEDLRGDGFVHGDGHRGARTGLAAADGHVADVDAVVAEDGAGPADHAGHVLVADKEHVPLGHHVEVEAHRLDEPRLHLRPAQSAAHHVLPVPAVEAQHDEARVVVALGDPRGLEAQAPVLREDRGVHEVERLVDHRGQEALLGRDVQQTRVEAGDLAPVLYPERVAGAVRELVEEAAQSLAQPGELGDELGALAHGHGGVYGVQGDLAPERGGDLLGGRYARAVLGLGGAWARGGGFPQVWGGGERGLRRRLLGEDVERRPAYDAALERLVERGLVHDAPARNVYEVGGGLHLREDLRVYEPYRLRRTWDVQGDEVGVLEDLIRRRGPVHVHRAHPVLGDVGVVGEHPHPHPDGAAGDDGPDVPEAYQAQRLLPDLDTLERAPLPLPALERGVGRGYPPGGGEHEA